MPFNIGTAALKKVFFGTTEVKEVFDGTTKVWAAEAEVDETEYFYGTDGSNIFKFKKSDMSKVATASYSGNRTPSVSGEVLYFVTTRNSNIERLDRSDLSALTTFTHSGSTEGLPLFADDNYLYRIIHGDLYRYAKSDGNRTFKSKPNIYSNEESSFLAAANSNYIFSSAIYEEWNYRAVVTFKKSDMSTPSTRIIQMRSYDDGYEVRGYAANDTYLFLSYIWSYYNEWDEEEFYQIVDRYNITNLSNITSNSYWTQYPNYESFNTMYADDTHLYSFSWGNTSVIRKRLISNMSSIGTIAVSAGDYDRTYMDDTHIFIVVSSERKRIRKYLKSNLSYVSKTDEQTNNISRIAVEKYIGG